MKNKDNNIFISIIIPVFNTEEYLGKCLKSCLMQNIPYDKYEMIIVNDGSTDNSCKIIEKYKKKYSNIHIINQKNMGLSEARNNGLKIAKGKYIWFVDSDDSIDNNSLSILNKICIYYKPEVITFGAKNYRKNEFIKNRPSLIESNILLKGISVIESDKYQTCATLFIYSRKFLEKYKLKFYPNIYHEDLEFVPRVIFNAESVFSIKKNIYFVNERSGSITRSNILKKSDDLLIIAKELYYYFFVETNIEKYKIKRSISTKIAIILNSSIYNCRYNEEKIKTIVKYISKTYYLKQCYIKSKLIKHKIEGIILYNYKVFLFLYKIIIKYNIPIIK